MAPSLKRKREYIGDGGDDDDDDAIYGLRQTLPVANLPIDFDGEPMDGMQYLFTVRRDARKLPDIKHVDNPYARSPPQPAQSAIAVEQQDVGEPSPLPNKEWRSEFERRFRNFRGNISQPTVRPQQAGPFQKMMPDRKNRDAWWAFLEGAPESAWNPSRGARHRNERGGQRHGATQQPLDGDTPQKSRELSPTQLFQLDHRFSIHLVMYFTHWFNLYLASLDSNTTKNDDDTTTTYTPTDVHMRWIFALLTRIDLFCSADDTSCLRNLARACLALIAVVRRRNKVGSPPLAAHDEHADGTGAVEMDTSGRTETQAASPDAGEDTKSLSECSMWIVFCAVTNFWGQRDLWDDAEQTLRQSHR